jgi:hypothetical protein
VKSRVRRAALEETRRVYEMGPDQVYIVNATKQNVVRSSKGNIMATDIDNALRRMGLLPGDESETKVSEEPATGEDTSLSSSSLSSDDDHRPPHSSVRLLRPNEVAIDGIIYDIDSFQHVHPGGGDVIAMFGGRDATVAYHMIHPYHHAHDRLAAAKLPVVATIPNHAPE